MRPSNQDCSRSHQNGSTLTNDPSAEVARHDRNMQMVTSTVYRRAWIQLVPTALPSNTTTARIPRSWSSLQRGRGYPSDAAELSRGPPRLSTFCAKTCWPRSWASDQFSDEHVRLGTRQPSHVAVQLRVPPASDKKWQRAPDARGGGRGC